MDAFSVEIPINDPGKMEEFNKLMDLLRDETTKDIQTLAEKLNVSENCASAVFYLRSRSRWTQELEDELIRLHKSGTPPNICEFGN